MPEPALTSTIASILQEDDLARRTRELTALRDREPLEPLDAILWLLGSPEEILRRRALRSLSLFHEYFESRAQILADHLVHNPDTQVRLSCAIKLMHNSTPPVTQAYHEALEDPFDKVAQIACLEVGHRGGAGSTEALIQILGHKSWRVRLEACKALITQGKADGRVVTTLEHMAQEAEARVYDAECDEFAAIEQDITREFGEWPPGGPSWGKLHTILERARNQAR